MFTMSSSTNNSCGPCEYEGYSRSASKWCISCEEGLCKDCEKVHGSIKNTREHELISIQDFVDKIEIVKIEENCKNHDGKLELYCKVHEEVLCATCFSASHINCQGVMPLGEASKNAKKSAALDDLEQSIDVAITDLKHCIQNRKLAIKDIKGQKQRMKQSIKETKAKLNENLDKLQQELDSKCDECKSEYKKTVKELKSFEKKFLEIKRQNIQLKEFANNLHVFLGILQMKNALTGEIVTVSNTLDSAFNYKIELELNAICSSLIDGIDKFGFVKIVESNSKLMLHKSRTNQAQIHVTEYSGKSIEKINLQKIKKIEVESSGKPRSVDGCVIMPDNRLLIANSQENTSRLIEYNAQGEHTRDINVPLSGRPYDIAVIDSDRIALSCDTSNCIEILNIKNNVVEKKIEVGEKCFGVSFQDRNIYTVVHNTGILVFDLTGKLLNTIEYDVMDVKNLTTSKDRIYLTDWFSSKICCLSGEGIEKWVFQETSIMSPQGLSIDADQNVFVVCWESNNLIVINRDGTLSKTLLCEDDGLVEPHVVYLQKESNTLAIGDKHGGVSLYRVT